MDFHPLLLEEGEAFLGDQPIRGLSEGESGHSGCVFLFELGCVSLSSVVFVVDDE